MSGKTSGLTALETRKQLLVLESNLNRAALIADAAAIKAEISRLAEPMRAVGSMASLAMQVGTSVAGIFRREPAGGPAGAAPTPLAMRALRVGLSLWSELRSRRQR